jgi:folate-binding protein YgfZ
MNSAARDICRRARSHGLAGPLDGVPDLGLVLATGPDCLEFLHARLTSDVRALAPGQGHLSAKLTGRGELVSYFSLHRLPDLGRPHPTFFMVAPRGDLALLLTDLNATLITEDVLLEDVSDQFAGFLVQGPAADNVLRRLGCLPAADPTENSVCVPPGETLHRPADLLVLVRSFTGDPGRLLLWGTASGGDFPRECRTAAAEENLTWVEDAPEQKQAWRWLAVEAGWPNLDRDLVSGKSLLPKTGLDHQVASATKGCYPGQEVVARIRTYGSVPTALRGLLFKEAVLERLEDLPEPGSDLLAGGAKVGTWGSAAWSVTRDALICLAFVGRDHRTPGTLLPLDVGPGTLEAEVVMPPFFRASDQGERSRQLYDEAIGLFSSGHDARAVQILEQVIRLDPGLHDAYEALGVILGRGEKFLEAIDIFRRLEEVAPNEPMVHTNLSLFYMKIGDKDEAEKQKAQATLKRFASAADPAEARAMQNAAETAGREDAGRRIGMFTEVLAIDPEDPLALMGMGKALSDLADHGQADSYLERALAAQPDNSALYAARGKTLEALGKPNLARDIYRRGIAVASRKGDLMPLKDMEHRLLMLAD